MAIALRVNCLVECIHERAAGDPGSGAGTGTGLIYTYGLNARGRIVSVANDNQSVASYIYDISEQRIAKTLVGGATLHYHYDDEGRLIAETDGNTGETLREYVWLGLTPVAVIITDPQFCDATLISVGQGGLPLDCTAINANTPPGSPALYYLHTDHLGRPNMATDTGGNIVWDGGLGTPFGQGIATMGAITQKLMFPGQYVDEDTGYAQNWHRTYDPTLWRYLQSDPIGLTGGLNRYAYVGGNPVSMWILWD